MTFELPLEESFLRVDVSTNRWSTWILVADGSSIRLGAENIDVLRRRVIDRLTKQHEGAGVIDGRMVQWVCSFAENHHSIYCVWSEPQRDVFFQDGQARIVWRDGLSPADLERWSKALEAG